MSVGALEALERLQVGNRRFIEGHQTHSGITLRDQLEASAREQRPFAIVIGCSDSRVPLEIVFDQGIGDLFVIRVAGNVVAPSQIGSVEFAAEQFGTELVVVLGHSNCGAIQATLDQLHQPSDQRSANLHAIVDRIRPAVEELIGGDLEGDAEAMVRAGVRANVRSSVEQLRHGSEILENLISTERLHVVGAEYSLTTGLVEFFEGVG
jgi:carbonic anhydrase